MKKIVAFLLVVCLCIGLCACASMDTFKDNLGSDYRKTELDDDDLEAYEEMLDIDADDYDVKSAIQAVHKKKGTTVVIIECGSNAKANELSDDAEDIIDFLKKSYSSSYSFGISVEGRFVLLGEESAIEDALDE